MNNKADNQYKQFKTVEYLRYWNRVIKFKYFVEFLVKWYKNYDSESIKNDNEKNIKKSILLYIEIIKYRILKLLEILF